MTGFFRVPPGTKFGIVSHLQGQFQQPTRGVQSYPILSPFSRYRKAVVPALFWLIPNLSIACRDPKSQTLKGSDSAALDPWDGRGSAHALLRCVGKAEQVVSRGPRRLAPVAQRVLLFWGQLGGGQA